MKRTLPVLMLVSIVCACRAEKTGYPDFSSPEKTVITLHEAIKREDLMTAQECYLPKIEKMHPGFVKYKVAKTKKVSVNDDWSKKGDVEVIVERYFENRPPLHMSFLLRKVSDRWKITDSVYMADENYPPEGGEPIYEDEFEKTPEGIKMKRSGLRHIEGREKGEEPISREEWDKRQKEQKSK